jgi:hypothetical protein
MQNHAAGRQFTLLILALALMLHVPLLSAAANTEALSVMDWPLQPGESVRDLSRLIYPKSQQMQKYFIAETIRLNLEAQPDLHPTTVFEQEHQIIIPSIKVLSRKSVSKAAPAKAAQGD